MSIFRKQLESGEILTLGYSSGISCLANCGLGQLSGVYGNILMGDSNKAISGSWHNPNAYLKIRDFKQFWPLLDEKKDEIIQSLGNFNTILISDRADLGKAEEQNATYFKAYNFVEWIIGRGIGAVWQSPCAFNWSYGRTHITQVWAWYPRANVMVDLETPSFIPAEFRKQAEATIKAEAKDNPHIRIYRSWREYLIELSNNPPPPAPVKPKPVDPGLVQKTEAIQAADYRAVAAQRPWNQALNAALNPVERDQLGRFVPKR